MIPLWTLSLKLVGDCLYTLKPGSSAAELEGCGILRALCHFAAAHLETPPVAVATRAVEVCPRGWEVPSPPFSRRPRGQAPPLRYAGVGVCRYHGKGALVGHILPRGGSALGIREGG